MASLFVCLLFDFRRKLAPKGAQQMTMVCTFATLETCRYRSKTHPRRNLANFSILGRFCIDFGRRFGNFLDPLEHLNGEQSCWHISSLTCKAARNVLNSETQASNKSQNKSTYVNQYVAHIRARACMHVVTPEHSLNLCDQEAKLHNESTSDLTKSNDVTKQTFVTP